MPLYKAKCSMCHVTFRSRSRSKNLEKIRKHIWKKHRSSMIRRIKDGIRKRSEGNPSLQDLATALLDSPRAAIEVYKSFTEAQYKYTKTIMDAIEPILPDKVSVSWKVVEAFHDAIMRT